MARRTNLNARTLVAAVALTWTLGAQAAPTGAKAIFDTGQGARIGMSAAAPQPARTEAVAQASSQPYTGISYQILMVGADGQLRAVPKSRVFTSGERIQIIASTNRPGYLTVANIGSSGRLSVLFSEYVEARRPTQIPARGTLRFDATPGTERILLMVSSEPNPIAAPAGAAPGSVGTGMQAGAALPPQPLPGPAPGPVPTPAALPGPAPTMENLAAMDPPGMKTAANSQQALVASLEGAKSMKARGAKDLMVDDDVAGSYTVVSPRQGYKPVASSAKDLVVETAADGMNYGVVPTSAIAGGGILTLEINLRHR